MMRKLYGVQIKLDYQKVKQIYFRDTRNNKRTVFFFINTNYLKIISYDLQQYFFKDL